MSDRPLHPFAEALTAGMADALTKDWPGDTRIRTAPAIVDYLLALPAVRAALRSTPATPSGYDWNAPYEAALRDHDECCGTLRNHALRSTPAAPQPDAGSRLDRVWPGEPGWHTKDECDGGYTEHVHWRSQPVIVYIGRGDIGDRAALRSTPAAPQPALTVERPPVHSKRHDRDDTREDCPECWEAAAALRGEAS